MGNYPHNACPVCQHAICVGCDLTEPAPPSEGGFAQAMMAEGPYSPEELEPIKAEMHPARASLPRMLATLAARDAEIERLEVRLGNADVLHEALKKECARLTEERDEQAREKVRAIGLYGIAEIARDSSRAWAKRWKRAAKEHYGHAEWWRQEDKRSCKDRDAYRAECEKLEEALNRGLEVFEIEVPIGNPTIEEMRTALASHAEFLKGRGE